MCYDAEPCEFHSAKVVVARKRHQCAECKAPIPVGVRHHYIAGKNEGDFWTGRQHLECQALWRFCWEELCEGEGAMVLGGLADELVEYADATAQAGEVPHEPGGPTLVDLFDAIREGYERQAVAP